MTTTAVSNSRTQIMLLMGDVTHRNEKIVGRTSDLIVKVNFKFNNLDSLSFPLGSEPTMQSSFLKLGKLLTAATKPTREGSKLQRSLSLKSTFNFLDTEQRYCPFSSGVTFHKSLYAKHSGWEHPSISYCSATRERCSLLSRARKMPLHLGWERAANCQHVI